jgi:hypothetical protein
MGFRHPNNQKTLKDPDEVKRMPFCSKMFNVVEMHTINTYIKGTDKTAEMKILKYKKNPFLSAVINIIR